MNKAYNRCLFTWLPGKKHLFARQSGGQLAVYLAVGWTVAVHPAVITPAVITDKLTEVQFHTNQAAG